MRTSQLGLLLDLICVIFFKRVRDFFLPRTNDRTTLGRTCKENRCFFGSTLQHST